MEVKLLSVECEGDFSGEGDYEVEIKIDVAGQEISDKFYVQLSGGEYLSQMGCWITADGSGGDINFDDYRDGIFSPFLSDIISAAEIWYEEENELDKDGWKFVRDTMYCDISATSSSRITVEKNEERLENEEDDAYRAYTDNSGFTQPNDYSNLPNFRVEYFDSEPSDELLEEIFGDR
jgi:hypothetical protein